MIGAIQPLLHMTARRAQERKIRYLLIFTLVLSSMFNTAALGTQAACNVREAMLRSAGSLTYTAATANNAANWNGLT